MSFGNLKSRISRAALLAFGLGAGVGCTQSVPSQFKLLPEQTTASGASESMDVVVSKESTPVDILWVVDNSASMSTSQTKLKNGLSAFATKYLTKAGTDIQLAVITTDTYVANRVWQDYLNTPNPGTKQTPLQYHESHGDGHAQFGPDYAKLSSTALMSTKESNLVSNFRSRVTVGTKGIYEEHGFDSVMQFLRDNEEGNSPNKLFRPNSQRVIIFLSDEDDQSMGENAHSDKLLYGPDYYSGANPDEAKAILPSHFTIDCPPETVDGIVMAPMTLCVRPEVLEPVSTAKQTLDSFFTKLDGNSRAPSYFVTAIVGKDVKTIQNLRDNTQEKNGETKKIVITNEIGTRYLDLVKQVGNGSFAMDIGATDYTPILDKIGLEIERRSVKRGVAPHTTYVLLRAPDLREKIVVTLNRAAGGDVVLKPSQYSVVSNKLELTDKVLVSSLQPGDRISVQYQPSTVRAAGI